MFHKLNPGLGFPFAEGNQNLFGVRQGTMLVRHLDWQESVAAEQSQQATATNNSSGGVDETQLAADQAHTQTQTQTRTQTQTQTLAPQVALDAQFDVVIGTDIMYEVSSTFTFICTILLCGTCTLKHHAKVTRRLHHT